MVKGSSRRHQLSSSAPRGFGRLVATAASALALAVFPGFCAADPSDALATVASVDLDRYLGRWYEIARLPNRFESQCASDVEARYRREPAGIQVLNRCRKADGGISESNGHAKIVAGSQNAKLRVTFFWPFYGDYWILALDPDYTEVLVGAPSRKFAWVLSRRPDMPEDRLASLLARAQALGFDSSAFLKTAQLKPLAQPTAPVDGDGGSR